MRWRRSGYHHNAQLWIDIDRARIGPPVETGGPIVGGEVEIRKHETVVTADCLARQREALRVTERNISWIGNGTRRKDGAQPAEFEALTLRHLIALKLSGSKRAVWPEITAITVSGIEERSAP